jgi:SAM-dependent methyltransferase
MATRLKLRPVYTEPPAPMTDTARAYDTLATAYLDHAEGRQSGLFDFHGAHGFSDRALWARLDAMLVRLWTEGRRAIRILDLGCGPGTWLLRLAVRARDLGFSAIDGRGVDLSPAMIDLARSRLRCAADPHVGLRFDIGDLATALADEEDGSFDILLCLNGVLNHLHPDERARAVAEMERLCDGELFVTAHSLGGGPSTTLADAYDVRQFHRDHPADRLEIHLQDGRHLDLPLHLFTAAELAGLFSGRVRREALVGLDLFHTRFRSDPHWSPADADRRPLDEELDRLETLCEAIPVMIDAASQILFHGRVTGT